MLRCTHKSLYLLMTNFLITALLAGFIWPLLGLAAQTDIIGPSGSGYFGQTLTVLPNGNIVVTDPSFDSGGNADVGAVYLYHGTTGALISQLIGSTAGDQIGNGGVIVLTNGNYVVSSPVWDNGAAADAGAVTWGSVVTGVAGIVSAANSLVGSTSGDQVGYWDVTALPNGNYVVRSVYWNNGAATGAGAVTWGIGTMGVAGTVSAANSLVGSTKKDYVGMGGITVLPNGNYVVSSIWWDNGAHEDAGAVTWGSGTTGVTGVVSTANSLVGAHSDDDVGGGGVTVLTNGNYVVSSPYWADGIVGDDGAVTWGSGTAGITGTIYAANSLVGSTGGDYVGTGGVTALPNGNYVVNSYLWSNGAIDTAGAVTWGNGTTGITGVVSAANSLVGSTNGDEVGYWGVSALPNGNYVVSSPRWDNGAAADAGAVTWGSGTMSITGAVSVTNSLVGSTNGDQVGGDDVTVLPNGNYVVSSYLWDNGAVADAGAVTWGSGVTGVAGAVSAANSLVGSTYGDWVGGEGVTVLPNGNYVVCSEYWYNGVDWAGAVTWGSGTAGITGAVSAANSLVGSTDGDEVGAGGVTALPNGNYVVSSYLWNNGAAAEAGAVTWGSGTSGITGTVSATNSLVGSTNSDRVGSDGVTALPNGNYVVTSFYWDSGAVADVGAVTWGSGTEGITGAVSAANSLVGSTTGDWVGYGGVTVLTNGNYVVSSYLWHNGAAVEAGAVTLGSGVTGVTGTVSAANSLVGSTNGDWVGYGGVTALPNGNYVVSSPDWDNGAAGGAGAVTWGSGMAGIAGAVSSANSLVGSTSGDWVGTGGVTALPNGNYVVSSPDWDNGAAADAGAITYGLEIGGVNGSITADNSVRGLATNGGVGMNQAYDSANQQLIVGRPADNIVTIFTADTPPVANAGPDQSNILPGTVVILDGSASSDPGGYTPLTYSWQQTGGPLVVLSSSTVVNPIFNAPSTPAMITFTLTVTNNLGLADLTPDEVVISTGISIGMPGYGSSPVPGSTIHVGSINPGSSITATLTVSETGNATLNVTDIQISGLYASDFHVSQTTFSITDGGPAHNLIIVCTPSASSQRDAILSIYHNAPSNPATYTLTCIGNFVNHIPLVVNATP